MARITVLGSTGYSGNAVIREAVARGHTVTAWSRRPAESPLPGVTYETGSLLNAETRRRAVAGSDVIVGAVSPRGDIASDFVAIYRDFAELAAAESAVWAVVGGYGSRRSVAGGPRIARTSEVPAEWRADAAAMLEINSMMEVVEGLEADAPAALNWFVISPPKGYGGNDPVAPVGSYRTGTDVDGPADASPRLAAADLARAILDEIESPQHNRTLFSIFV